MTPLAGVSQRAITSLLTNLEELCEEDEALEEALRSAEVVLDGAGEPACVSDLFDPTIDGLRGLLAPEAFPAQAFCTPAVRIEHKEINSDSFRLEHGFTPPINMP